MRRLFTAPLRHDLEQILYPLGNLDPRMRVERIRFHPSKTMESTETERQPCSRRALRVVLCPLGHSVDQFVTAADGLSANPKRDATASKVSPGSRRTSSVYSSHPPLGGVSVPLGTIR